jgi:hypothetical protein
VERKTAQREMRVVARITVGKRALGRRRQRLFRVLFCFLP